ncbi:MAG: SH3 domain-containing protein, partial [Clostridia bacterium]|nr:SH3 domain-containing protein [Clostridia bacterium]
MKKKISFILYLILIFALLSGCKNNREPLGSNESVLFETSENKESFLSEGISSENSSVSSSDSSSVISSVISNTPSNTVTSEDKVSSVVKKPESQESNVSSESSDTKPQVSEPTSKTVKAQGIDVSKWQGKIDWKKVKNDGNKFAIIRIGYRGENGKILKDDNADYNIQQADKAGLLVGVYFFSTAINSAEALEEAKWTVSMIEGYPISYPVVYDCEGFEETDSRMNKLDIATRTQNAVTFLNHIKSCGYDAMFYGAKTDLMTKWDMSILENGYKIWVAHYPSNTYPNIKVPDYSGKYDMWQYTNKGSVLGVKGGTDIIVSYFESVKAAPRVNKTIETAKPPVEKDEIYTAVNDTVTAKNEVNLRDGAGTDFNIVGTLKNGATLKRIATGINGWSKLEYKGKTVYAITSYLTTDLSFKPQIQESSEADSIYTSVNEKVTAKSETNLRTAASTKGSQVVHTLKNGETVTRTGVGSNGWSRLQFNGQTVYAISSYLTTDLNSKPSVSEETPSQNNEMVFTDIDEQVTAKSETNLRTKPTTSGDSQVVYTLKNGEYIKRTGISESGWSRLIYNGQTVYAVSSYLTN